MSVRRWREKNYLLMNKEEEEEDSEAEVRENPQNYHCRIIKVKNGRERENAPQREAVEVGFIGFGESENSSRT